MKFKFRKELRVSKEKPNHVTNDNNQLKQLVDLNHYKLDSLKQYDKRENLQNIHVGGGSHSVTAGRAAPRVRAAKSPEF